jgi:phosphoglycolate phosphatase
MRYRLAIFDFDGTLADSFPWFMEAMKEIADEFRFRRIEDHEVDALRGYEARRLAAHLGMPMWKMPLVARSMRRRMAADAGRIPLFPGAGAMLRALADAGVTLAIVTSNSEANVRRVLGPENAALVRHYGCGAAIFGKAPKLRKVLRDSGVPAAQALSIGDEIRDLHASRVEGIAFGAVAWGLPGGARRAQARGNVRHHGRHRAAAHPRRRRRAPAPLGLTRFG